MNLKAEKLGDPRQPLLNIYLISGDEPLLIGEALDALRSRAKSEDFSLRDTYFVERYFNWNDLTAAGQSMSLFAERKIIDVRMPSGKPGKDGAAIITELAQNPPPDTLIIISTGKLDKSQMSSRWVKAIDKAGAVVRIWPVEVDQLGSWIAGRLKQRGLSAPPDAIAALSRRVEGNLLAAQQEIDKLALLHGEGSLSAQDIADAVADSSRFNVFKLVDEAMSGNGAKAVRMLGNLRREGIAPAVISWALAKEVRQLTAMSEAMASGMRGEAVLQRFRVWSSRQSIVKSALQRHTTESFYQMLAMCEQADRASKGQSAREPWQLFLALCAKLSGDKPVRNVA